VFGYIAFVIVNLLANVIRYNGVTTAYWSDYYANLFAPSGLIFAIWGAIYILVGAFVVYQARGYRPELTTRIGYWFLLSCVFNIVWLFLWHYDFIPLTLIVMILLFFSLLMIYLRLGISTGFTKENIIERLPFSVYLGWISVATIGNVATLLVYLNPALVNPNVAAYGIAQDIWTILIVAIAVVLCLAVLFTRKDIAYSLVFEWALFGILIKRLSDFVDVAVTAAIGMVAILIGILIVWFRYWRPSSKGAKRKNK
jgi:hypothetical protein